MGLQVPTVLLKTHMWAVQVCTCTCTGMGFMGTGLGWTLPTHTVPMCHPNYIRCGSMYHSSLECLLFVLVSSSSEILFWTPLDFLSASTLPIKADHELYPWVWVPIPVGFYVSKSIPGLSRFSGTRYLYPWVFRNQVPDTHRFSGTARHSQAQSGTDLSVL